MTGTNEPARRADASEVDVVAIHPVPRTQNEDGISRNAVTQARAKND